MDTKPVITISYGQRVQSVPFTTLPSYEELLNMVKKLFPNIDDQQLNLFYVDDEGDHVAAKSDMELSEAYRLAEHQNKHDVRLYVGKVEEVQEPIFSDPTEAKLVPFYMTMDPEEPSNFTSDKELDVLGNIHHKLNEMTLVVSHLTKTKREQIEKMQQESEYQKQIFDLEKKFEALEEEKRDVIDQNEELKAVLKEKEEQLNKRLAESNILREDLAAKLKDISTLKDTTTLMATQLNSKVREVLELKKEKEGKMLLESKIDLLNKQLEDKNTQALQMSRVINEVQAEKDFLSKKVGNLEQELEKEHQEKENLQQSIVSLQHSQCVDPSFSHKLDTKNGHFWEPGPMVIGSEVKSGAINILDLPPEGQRWHIELEALSQMGYKDYAKNIELLNKYQDVTKVVSDLHKIGQAPRTSSIPDKHRELPKDISEVEIQMLEAMGFHDLDILITLLRKHKDVAVVVETLLSTVM